MRILSLKTLKSILTLRNLKRALRERSGASGPSMTFASQKLFFFLVIVHDRVADGNKHSYKTFDFETPSFHATSLLKIEAKQFFTNTM